VDVNLVGYQLKVHCIFWDRRPFARSAGSLNCFVEYIFVAKRCQTCASVYLISINVPLPRRGYDSKPRVAASATLGTKQYPTVLPQRGCDPRTLGRNRLAVENPSAAAAQVSRSGNPGLWVV